MASAMYGGYSANPYGPESGYFALTHSTPSLAYPPTRKLSHRVLTFMNFILCFLCPDISAIQQCTKWIPI